MKQLLNTCLTATPQELLHRLGSLPGAVRNGRRRRKRWKDEDSGFVYVPGALPPEQRVLLIAHVDTVAGSAPTAAQLYWRGNIVTRRGVQRSYTDKQGKVVYYRDSVLGADDRAGVAATWTMRNTGHSLLWTDGEERGGLGAQRAVDLIGDELAQHAYAVEIDRAGDKCLAFYTGSSCVEWEDWLGERLPDWLQESGTYTDLATICPAVQICGVNFAAGYLNQHTNDEVLFVDALERSVAAVRRLISSEPPAPVLVPEKYVAKDWSSLWKPNGKMASSTGWWGDKDDEDDDDVYIVDLGDTKTDASMSEADEAYERWLRGEDDDADVPPMKLNAAGDVVPS